MTSPDVALNKLVQSDASVAVFVQIFKELLGLVVGCVAAGHFGTFCVVKHPRNRKPSLGTIPLDFRSLKYCSHHCI